jgi:hypothetical protein
MMRVLAQSQRRFYLVGTTDTEGVVVDVPKKTVSREMSLAAWLSHGARRWVQAEEGSRTSRLALSLVEDKTAKEKSVQVKADDCGTGAGGFQEGNDCAVGHGRPPSDRRQGPVTEAERDAFGQFLNNQGRIVYENRGDLSKVSEDGDGNKIDEVEGIAGEVIGGFDTRDEGVARMKELERPLSDQEKADLEAWSRNPTTVVNALRTGESELDAKDKKIKEFEEVLKGEWTEDVLQNIESMPADEQKEALVNLARRIRYASNKISNNSAYALTAASNQLPKQDGTSEWANEEYFAALNAEKRYSSLASSLLEFEQSPEDHSTEKILGRIRTMRERYDNAYAPMKALFDKVHDIERDYIDRLGSTLDRNIRADGQQVTVYRGIRVDNAGAKRLYDDILRGDDRFEFTAPNSTSLSSKVAADFAKVSTQRGASIVMEIKTRKGVPIGSVSQWPDESEIVLPPRSNARITSRKLVFSTDSEKPILYVQMEMEDE